MMHQLERRHAAADTDLEPASAQVIEDADFLDQSQWRIERQEINERAKVHAPGSACDGAEPNSRHRNSVERRGVMFGDVVAIKAGLIGRRDEAQTLIELRGQGTIVAVDVVEEAKFHGLSGPCSGHMGQGQARAVVDLAQGRRDGKSVGLSIGGCLS